MVIDKNITMADLKGTLDEFAKAVVWTGDEDEIPSSSFPIYRAECRDGCVLLQMRWKGLPFLSREPVG